MEETFFSNMDRVAKQAGFYDLVTGNLLAGLLFTLICLFTIRFLVRAWLLSSLGRKSGVFVSVMLEAFALLFLLISAWRNPGVVVAALVWGTFILKTILHSF